MLTKYQLSCGCIERAGSPERGTTAVITMWWEHCCYHIRAHNHVLSSRLEWETAKTLKEARRIFSVMKKRYL